MMNRKAILIAAVLAALAGAVSAANMRVNGEPARKMWEALNLMAKLEDLPIHTVDGAADTITVRSLACASEMYDACSMFVKVNGEEKLIVHLDAAGKIIDALYAAGIYPSEDDPSLSQTASLVSCTRTNGAYECRIEE